MIFTSSLIELCTRQHSEIYNTNLHRPLLIQCCPWPWKRKASYLPLVVRYASRELNKGSQNAAEAQTLRQSAYPSIQRNKHLHVPSPTPVTVKNIGLLVTFDDNGWRVKVLLRVNLVIHADNWLVLYSKQQVSVSWSSKKNPSILLYLWK